MNSPRKNRLQSLILQYRQAKEEEKKNLAASIAALLDDTAKLAEFAVLGGKDPLFLTAMAVQDAFEAACNGMRNPEAEAELERLPADGIFGGWKLLAQAVRSLYGGSSAQAAETVRLMPAYAPQKKLAALFEELACKKKRALSPMQAKLFAALEQSENYAESAALALSDAYDSGDAAFFTETAAYYVKDLLKSDEQAALSVLLWSFKSVLERDWPPEEAVQLVNNALPKPESWRVLALAGLHYDAGFSVTAWLNYLAALPLEADETLWREACVILGQMACQAQKEQADAADFEVLWFKTKQILRHNLTFADSIWPSAPSLWQEAALLAGSAAKQRAGTVKAELKKSAQERQLELF